MSQKTCRAKRERHYPHIKECLLEGGKSASLAQEIAARVVNKERAQHGLKGRCAMHKVPLEVAFAA
jgi:hypothetical protein